MRRADFGATGKTGREVVKQALDEGHEVTAFARHVIPAMERHGVRRLVSLVGAGVRDPAGQGPPSPGRTSRASCWSWPPRAGTCARGPW